MSSPRKRPKRRSSAEKSPFVEAMQVGARLLQAGRAKDALPYLKRAYRLDPADVDAAINLGGAYVMLNRSRQAIPILEEASRRTENSKAWTNLGAAYLGNPILATVKKQESAIAAFEKALELDPAAPSVNYNLGLVCRDQGKLDLAIAHFRRAAAINPHDQDARRLLVKLEGILADQAGTPDGDDHGK